MIRALNCPGLSEHDLIALSSSSAEGLYHKKWRNTAADGPTWQSKSPSELNPISDRGQSQVHRENLLSIYLE